MKTNGKFNAMSFGFSTVNAGQRNVSVEPQLIVTSTEGNFRITPAISKALNIQNGEYAMFVHNIDNINAAISAQDETLVAYCNENGLDITTAEAAKAIHKEFDMIGIAKGIMEYDAKGNYKTAPMRLSKKDKLTAVSQNFDEFLATAMEQAEEEIKDALSREDITKEEQIEILSQFVVPEETAKYKGSKVANPAGLSGIGTSLNFTDTNVWKQLKEDLTDEEAKNINRIYDLDVNDIQIIPINNGYEDVKVSVLVLGDFVDKEPVRRETSKEAE